MGKKIGHDTDLVFGSNGEMNACALCGKEVGKNPKWVQVYNGGAVWAKSEGEPERDSGYMGWYPVGSECAKKFERGVLYTLAEEGSDKLWKEGE